jgi:hypothetical protein
MTLSATNARPCDSSKLGPKNALVSLVSSVDAPTEANRLVSAER